MPKYISIYWATTFEEKPAKNKSYNLDGIRDPSKFTKQTNIIEVYYNNMPNIDIVNRKLQFWWE